MVAILASVVLAFVPFKVTLQGQYELLKHAQQGKLVRSYDQWGNKIRLITLTNFNVVTYTAQSAGSDQDFDTPDDLYLNIDGPWPRRNTLAN